MMELLLTHGYFLYEDPKELRIMKPYVPLGILYISSYLRSKGRAVEVFDTTFAERADLVSLLRSTPPAVLGVYANLMTRPNVLAILRAAKEAGWKTVAGGPEPAAYADEYLWAGADVVVIGEGEKTLEELLPALREGSTAELANVRGIAFRGEDGSTYRTPARPLIPDIDRQPWPDRERVDIERYVGVWREHHGAGSVSLITARGCPYRCRWCSHAVFGQTHRRRNPSSVADEVEWLIQRYQPDMAWMADDVFTIHYGWLQKYSAELKRRGIRLPFECISRADRLNAQAMDTLAEMGCFRVWIGSESGSQRLLDAMERGVKVEQVRTAVELAKSRGIQTGMFLMWGYGDENLDDIEATIDHVKRTDPDVYFTTVSYPIKGTPYYEEMAARLVNLKPWREGSDRECRIRGRHSRRFYAFADELLRSETEMHRLIAGSKGAPEGDQDSPAALGLRQRILQAREGLRTAYNEVEA